MALGVVLSDPGSTSKAFANLSTELVKEKAAQEKAQAEAKTLTRAVEHLKI
jgi:hypothetical protein